MDMEFIPPVKTKRFRFSVEPAYNAVCSFCLLNEKLGGLTDWVTRTAAGMTPEQLAQNEELCGATYMNGVSWPSFLAWLDDLEKRSPGDLVQSHLDHVLLKARVYLGPEAEIPGREELRKDREVYVGLCERICEKLDCKDKREEIVRGYEKLRNPEILQKRIVSHFRMMWEKHLAREWERVEPNLRDSVAAFESLDFSGKSTEETLLQIIDRDRIPEPIVPWLSLSREIIFIPSAHIGPYLLLIDANEQALRIVGRARIPEGANVRSPELSRTELLMRLDALSDENRLRILELIVKKGETTAQEVMSGMDMSQSSVSRHLSQLAATGYLSVRVADGVKRFSLYRNRLDDTFRALKIDLEIKE